MTYPDTYHMFLTAGNCVMSSFLFSTNTVYWLKINWRSASEAATSLLTHTEEKRHREIMSCDSWKEGREMRVPLVFQSHRTEVVHNVP